MSLRIALTAACLVLAFAGAAQARTPSVTRGKRLAIEACSACHQVTAHQPRPTPVGNTDTNEYVAAPDFAEVGRKFRHDEAGLRAFILAPDHPMREQTFVPRDLDDIVAYVRSLGR